MTKTNHLTISKLKYIIIPKEVVMLKEFMNYDFDVSKINFVYHNDGAYGSTTHTDRKNHGLAFLIEGKNTYEFS